jgi:hypothetical protein
MMRIPPNRLLKPFQAKFLELFCPQLRRPNVALHGGNRVDKHEAPICGAITLP